VVPAPPGAGRLGAAGAGVVPDELCGAGVPPAGVDVVGDEVGPLCPVRDGVDVVVGVDLVVVDGVVRELCVVEVPGRAAWRRTVPPPKIVV
jgi:hypothetical protein